MLRDYVLDKLLFTVVNSLENLFIPIFFPFSRKFWVKERLSLILWIVKFMIRCLSQNEWNGPVICIMDIPEAAIPLE